MQIWASPPRPPPQAGFSALPPKSIRAPLSVLVFHLDTNPGAQVVPHPHPRLDHTQEPGTKLTLPPPPPPSPSRLLVPSFTFHLI